MNNKVENFKKNHGHLFIGKYLENKLSQDLTQFPTEKLKYELEDLVEPIGDLMEIDMQQLEKEIPNAKDLALYLSKVCEEIDKRRLKKRINLKKNPKSDGWFYLNIFLERIEKMRNDKLSRDGSQ